MKILSVIIDPNDPIFVYCRRTARIVGRKIDAVRVELNYRGRHIIRGLEHGRTAIVLDPFDEKEIF